MRKTKLTHILRKHRRQPNELTTALSAITEGELLSGLVELFTAGELRLHSPKRERPLCQRFYRYDKRNRHVGKGFLSAARTLKNDEHREHYSIGGLFEQMRWDLRVSVSRTDKFKITNDFQSCYVRQILMRDPSLCGFFELARTSEADALVVDDRTWTDFANEHEAELWPEPAPKKKPANPAQLELAFGETA